MTPVKATSSEKRRLLESFIQLCEIPSPSGSEGKIGKLVCQELERLGLKVVEDGAAETCKAGCGNLLASIEGSSDGSILLCAHLDTVPVNGEIDVVRKEDFLENDHDAILGADNKAAVAVFLELARKYVQTRPAVGIELLFTVCEENGLRGAKAFNKSQLRSQFGFVFDHSSPIGELIVDAPTHQRIVAEFTGVSAHAGVCPEDGRSAIVAAAKAIDSMSLGRTDDRSSSNVGIVRGGSAVNIVPDSCKLLAETRSLDHHRAVEMAREMVDRCNWSAGICETDVQISVQQEFHAYSHPSESKAVRVATAALADVGLEAVQRHSGGGSDANAFQADGFECLNIANGTEAVHTPDERVAVSALETMLDLGHAIVTRSAGQ